MKTTKIEHCTYKSERSLKNFLFALEEEFKKHLVLFQSNLDIQQNIIDSLWVTSQRFLILTRGAVCVRPYPREQSDREEREIRAEFKLKKDDLCNSNTELSASLETLKQKCRTFDRTLANIDTSLPIPSQIVEGSIERQPLFYYIELYADFFKFFNDTQSQLSFLGKFLNVDNIKAILEYKHLLKPDKTVMDYFDKSICKGMNG